MAYVKFVLPGLTSPMGLDQSILINTDFFLQHFCFLLTHLVHKRTSNAKANLTDYIGIITGNTLIYNHH